MEEGRYRVALRVYPLGDETMRRLIASTLGRQSVDIWHTSVEVYDTEYYFQNGIMQAVPDTTTHGIPLKIHSLGVTDVPKIVFEDFLGSIAEDFAPHRYHLLRNNCNNFSETLAMYLVEESIPEYILELQKAALESDVLSSMVDMFFGASGAPGQA